MTKLIVTRRSGAYDLFAFCVGIFFFAGLISYLKPTLSEKIEAIKHGNSFTHTYA